MRTQINQKFVQAFFRGKQRHDKRGLKRNCKMLALNPEVNGNCRILFRHKIEVLLGRKLQETMLEVPTSRKSFFARDRERHALSESRNIRRIQTGNDYFALEHLNSEEKQKKNLIKNISLKN